jgi:hypothetical protein
MKLLLVSYHFQPHTSVGADRPNSLFAHAPRHVTIEVIAAAPVTAREGAVHRFETISDWRDKKQFLRKIPLQLVAKLIEAVSFYADWFWIKEILFASPPDRVGRFDAVYAVYPEFQALLIGLYYSIRYRKPLFIDFTDSITADPLFRQNRLQRIAQRLFEAFAVGRSSGILVIAEGYRNYYQRKYPASRVQLVYNGYDEPDFKGIPFPSRRERRPAGDATVRFVHFGNICASRQRDVRPLFEGIGRFLAARAERPPNIRIDFFGRYTPEEHRLAWRYDVMKVVTFRGAIAKRTGFAHIHREHDFLLFYGVPGVKSSVTAKLLEYFRLGKPIVGICEGNEAARMITRAGAGIVGAFTAESVAALFEAAVAGRIAYDPDPAYIRSFDRRVQAGEVFTFMHEALRES